MHQQEILARSQEDAMSRAAKLMEVEAGELEILEEYEPDEQDLQEFQKAENLTDAPKPDEVTLYLVRIAFNHYVKRAQEFTQGLIERFAPGATAEAVRFRNLIIIRLEVPEASILIGKQGATLDALQHVVVRCLLTEDEDFPDVMLDIENYREKKLVRLEREARNAADRAGRTGRKVPLSPMSPAERKFIHNCLKEMEGIRTESRGEDRGRHIVVESTNPAPRGGRGGGGRGGANRGGGRGGNGNRDFNRRGGNRGDRNGNRADDNRGNRGGGNRDRDGGFTPNNRLKNYNITEEQRSLLYGNVGQDSAQGFQDTELEDRRSLLPEYRETEGDDSNNDKLTDELE
ncbi:hypothetical protein IT570_10890 [Candidatus Sumerlaeota bacterium]|nr:hypothetical protein [Candidatus Sumerlaeota bacterium]